mgnify:CR=1 FL=1
MIDRVESQVRSAIMASVGQSHTAPEVAVRKLVHGLGYRFRLHRRELPGTPDLVFPGRKKVLFVHGCFWHGHGCRWGQLPKSKLDYWAPKIEANRARDARNTRQLRELGWSSLDVWQCDLKDPAQLVSKIKKFLGETKVG